MRSPGLGVLPGVARQRWRLQLRRDDSELHPGSDRAARRRRLSTEQRQPARVSLVDFRGAYINPYVVGINQGFSTLAPTTMAYSSAHQRLYLGYATGAIRYIDVNAAAPGRDGVQHVTAAVIGLASVGNFLLAQRSERRTTSTTSSTAPASSRDQGGILATRASTRGIRTTRASTSSATESVPTTCTTK